MKRHLFSVITVLIAIISLSLTISLPIGAVSESDPFQIVKIERDKDNADVIIVRFNKAASDAKNIFCWFGHDMGVDSETGYQGIHMDYGNSGNALVENNTALRVTFDSGVVDDFFSKEGKYFFVFHLGAADDIKTSGGETLTYRPVGLYQSGNYVGVLGFSDYIALSDIVTQGSQPAPEPLKVVKIERGTEADTIIVYFDKECVLDASKIFSWFGYDMGVNSETGYRKLAMWYGTSDNTLVENNTALRVKFDSGVVDEFFNEHEGNDGNFFFVFHQDKEGGSLTSTEGGELVYSPVELYNGENLVGTAGRATYIALSDIIENQSPDSPETADGILSVMAACSVVILAGLCLKKKKYN